MSENEKPVLSDALEIARLEGEIAGMKLVINTASHHLRNALGGSSLIEPLKKTLRTLRMNSFSENQALALQALDYTRVIDESFQQIVKIIEQMEGVESSEVELIPGSDLINLSKIKPSGKDTSGK